MTRVLTLKKEQLTELGTEQLASVVGATGNPFTLTCGEATLHTVCC
jgi:hypothetical protein